MEKYSSFSPFCCKNIYFEPKNKKLKIKRVILLIYSDYNKKSDFFQQEHFSNT